MKPENPYEKAIKGARKKKLISKRSSSLLEKAHVSGDVRATCALAYISKNSLEKVSNAIKQQQKD